MKRKIIRIDESACNGCGQCIPNCPEGAIQLIDGKARLVGDLFCDGLGACLGHCPEGAIVVEEREAEPYDEVRTMENVIRQGSSVIKAHLEHLRDHGETEYLRQALLVLKERGVSNPLEDKEESTDHGESGGQTGCPGSRSFAFLRLEPQSGQELASPVSELTHWPVQLHLISPRAPHYRRRHVVLAADCVAYAMADFHARYLRGRSLAIGCPKLDQDQEAYVEKVKSLVDDAEVESLTVIMMQVPCCMGLLRIVQEGVSRAARNVPIQWLVVGIDGKILRESTLQLA